MIERQKRLKEVYDHLRAHYGVHTQKDFADSIKYSRVYISAAMNGADRYLTDKLFTNICEAYPGVFNLDYLLTGEGELLTIEEEVHFEELEKQISVPDYGTDHALITSRVFESILKPIQDAHDKLVASLEKQIAEKDARIKQQDETIANLQKIIADLRAMPTVTNIEDVVKKYPFEVGVAEGPDAPRAQV